MHTLPGHPLRGARYWTVYPSNVQGRLIFETGAVDVPAYDARSFLGFFAFNKDLLRHWEEYLRHILATLQAEGGQQGFGISPDLAKGVVNYNKTYILNYVCGNGSAPVGLCQ